MTNVTSDQSTWRKLPTCLINLKNNGVPAENLLTCLTNFTNFRNICRKLLTCLTNCTNNRINCRKLSTCLTHFTNDWSNCRKPLTCLTNFTMTGVTAESRLLPWKTLLITGVTAEDRLPAWQTIRMTNRPLYFQSSFHMRLSITLLVCSHISQKSAQLWQNNIKQWRSSTQLISTTRVSPSLNSLNTKKTTTYHVENPGSDLEQALHVAGIHQLMGIMGFQASHLENLHIRWPSWMEVRVTGHNFENWPLKDHPCHVCFKLVYWFQRRNCISIFPIGSVTRIS